MKTDLTATSQLKIICAKCNKPVDEIFMTHNMMKDNYLLQVKCHGDVDNMILEGRTLFCEGVSFLTNTGIAFNTKRIQEVFKESEDKSLMKRINDEQSILDLSSTACPEASDRRQMPTKSFIKELTDE